MKMNPAINLSALAVRFREFRRGISEKMTTAGALWLQQQNFWSAGALAREANVSPRSIGLPGRASC